MREKLVIANWKMNGSSVENSRWIESMAALGSCSVKKVVCAPSVYLSALKAPLESLGIELGGQDCSDKSSGAFTGEVSAEMLADVGCRWCIVGHSERRTLHAEDDALVAAKAARLVECGIRPIICVGETLEERDSGRTEEVVLRQLQACLDVLDADKIGAVAYEPVWAIGTGKTAAAQDAQKVHQILRAHMSEAGESVPIIYGGSVKPSNAEELFSQPDIDGGLIGGAALVAEDFFKICELRSK